MQFGSIAQGLDFPEQLHEFWQSTGILEPGRATENLRLIRSLGIYGDLLDSLARQLQTILPSTSDPDRVLNDLERFLAASRSPLSRMTLFQRDPDALAILLRIFSVSQYLADLLVRDPEGFELLRLTGGLPVPRESLRNEIIAEVSATEDERRALAILRQFHQRETLRIAYGDFVVGMPLERVTQQISYLADAIVQGAVLFARQHLTARRGDSTAAQAKDFPFCVIAMGKLGGEELNYSSDLDLVYLYEVPTPTLGGRAAHAAEFFERLARSVTHLLTNASDFGGLYRVDMRLRPWGNDGPLATEVNAARRYYDLQGRTWERQALVKARTIAGDITFGETFLRRMEPWIYRRYLSRADITGIRTIKRKLERHSFHDGDDAQNVKTGRGGIRDIEFAIQFLQLLNGGDLPKIRVRNTLLAIAELENAQCLTMQERSILCENYTALRKIEHHLQIMFNLQTHVLPTDITVRDQLVLRLGFRTADGLPDRERFERDLSDRQNLNRQILDHLLHDAFSDDEAFAPETDLVLDPQPSLERAREVLAKYEFDNPDRALQHLQALATERLSFLSPRRCRHFLAAIAPHLLREIAETPNPEATLSSLVQVADSLGGKRVLWELFSANPWALRMFVRFCAASPYLTGILISNPGMIDELMDALVLNRLPTFEELSLNAKDLCKQAEDLSPILHSFRNSVHLQVGVRDILGKESIQTTHQTLSDTAEVCMHEVINREFEKLAKRYGDPLGDDGQPAELVVVGLGKLGAREPNYHSDLDVIFLYRCDGATTIKNGKGRESTSIAHFYNQLAQRVIQFINQLTSQGRLYDLDVRLRPSGRSGVLAVPLDQLQQYFDSGNGQLWERLMLVKARPVYGPRHARIQTMDVIKHVLRSVAWRVEYIDEIRNMRSKLEASASPQNLKRGFGGTMDVEFIAQMLQLQHASAHPEILQPGTLTALEQLAKLRLLDTEVALRLREGYHFLRQIESGLRLMDSPTRHDLPTDPADFRRLAYLLGEPSGEILADACREVRQHNRTIFQKIFEPLKSPTSSELEE